MGTAHNGAALRPAQLHPARKTTPVSTFFLWLGLFTLSWDRLAGISLGTFNLKLPVVAFALAFALTAIDRAVLRKQPVAPHVIPKLSALVVAVFIFAALFAQNVPVALAQSAATVLGALIPLFAVYLNLQTYGGLEKALTVLIRGGVVASVFGLYQLGAFYTGLPQLIKYEATGGGLGRISSFSYEAGYFGYFLILVIAAVFARAHLTHRPVNLWLVGFLLTVLILANSRATVLTLPLLFALAFFRKPDKKLRQQLVPLVFVAVMVVVFILLAMPEIFDTFIQRAATILDPTEQSSNAPRLNTFNVAWAIAQQNMLVGIGGGNFRDTLASITGVRIPGLATNEVIANNIWLQALLDGGVVLLVAEVALVLVAARTLYRRNIGTARLLMAGWLSVLLVSSMVTSYFFDIKMWVFLALTVVASMTPRSDAPEQAMEKVRPASRYRASYTSKR